MSRKKNKRIQRPKAQPDSPPIPDSRPMQKSGTDETRREESRREEDVPLAQDSPTSQAPSSGVRTALSLWVSFHLFAILVSFLAVVEPSGVHSAVVRLIRPYLQATHFGADDRPVYLAHGNASEQPHRVQVSSEPLSDAESADSAKWEDAGPKGTAGLAVSDRIHRWAASGALLAETGQASLVAELLLPVAIENSEAESIRIVRFPTDLNDVLANPESPYVARIIREQDTATLVQLKPKRLSAAAKTNVRGSSNE